MHKSLLSVQYNDCSNVIQRLLGERSKIAKELIQSHRFDFFFKCNSRISGSLLLLQTLAPGVKGQRSMSAFPWLPGEAQ